MPLDRMLLLVLLDRPTAAALANCANKSNILQMLSGNGSKTGNRGLSLNITSYRKKFTFDIGRPFHGSDNGAIYPNDIETKYETIARE